MKYFIGLFCIAIFFSCQHNTHVAHPISEIVKIEFAKTSSISPSQAAISIDSSLTYCYFNGFGTRASNYYIGKVSVEFWNTLNRKLNMIDFKRIRSDTVERVADVNYYELIIHWKNKRIRIVRSGFVVTDSLSSLASWIDYSHNNIKLIRSSGPIKFETTFQGGPPMPNLKDVRFPPPTAN